MSTAAPIAAKNNITSHPSHALSVMKLPASAFGFLIVVHDFDAVLLCGLVLQLASAIVAPVADKDHYIGRAEQLE